MPGSCSAMLTQYSVFSFPELVGAGTKCKHGVERWARHDGALSPWEPHDTMEQWLMLHDTKMKRQLSNLIMLWC